MPNRHGLVSSYSIHVADQTAERAGIAVHDHDIEVIDGVVERASLTSDLSICGEQTRFGKGLSHFDLDGLLKGVLVDSVPEFRRKSEKWWLFGLDFNAFENRGALNV